MINQDKQKKNTCKRNKEITSTAQQPSIVIMVEKKLKEKLGVKYWVKEVCERRKKKKRIHCLLLDSVSVQGNKTPYFLCK